MINNQDLKIEELIDEYKKVGIFSVEYEKKKAQKTTAKKSTKKESAKVEKKEIEKLSFSKLLETLDTTGLHTSSGLKKENLYNSSIYADCLTDKDKTPCRRFSCACCTRPESRCPRNP